MLFLMLDSKGKKHIHTRSPEFQALLRDKGARPLALRVHVTNVSFKQWVRILLMPKIDRAHKNYLIPEIWEETHEGRYFMALWFFNKVVWFVLASNMAANTTFCLCLVKRLNFGHVTIYEPTHFKKMVQVWKAKSLILCLRYDPQIHFRRRNHITFIFIQTMSRVLSRVFEG